MHKSLRTLALPLMMTAFIGCSSSSIMYYDSKEHRVAKLDSTQSILNGGIDDIVLSGLLDKPALTLVKKTPYDVEYYSKEDVRSAEEKNKFFSAGSYSFWSKRITLRVPDYRPVPEIPMTIIHENAHKFFHHLPSQEKSVFESLVDDALVKYAAVVKEHGDTTLVEVDSSFKSMYSILFSILADPVIKAQYKYNLHSEIFARMAERECELQAEAPMPFYRLEAREYVAQRKELLLDIKQMAQIKLSELDSYTNDDSLFVVKELQITDLELERLSRWESQLEGSAPRSPYSFKFIPQSLQPFYRGFFSQEFFEK